MVPNIACIVSCSVGRGLFDPHKSDIDALVLYKPSLEAKICKEVALMERAAVTQLVQEISFSDFILGIGGFPETKKDIRVHTIDEYLKYLKLGSVLFTETLWVDPENIIVSSAEYEEIRRKRDLFNVPSLIRNLYKTYLCCSDMAGRVVGYKQAAFAIWSLLVVREILESGTFSPRRPEEQRQELFRIKSGLTPQQAQDSSMLTWLPSHLTGGFRDWFRAYTKDESMAVQKLIDKYFKEGHDLKENARQIMELHLRLYGLSVPEYD